MVRKEKGRVQWFFAFVVVVCLVGPLAPGTAAPAPGTPTYEDALQLYQKGRSLENAGRQADAERSFRSSLAIVEKLLLLDPGNVDFVNLQCWDLFRLGQHKDVVVKAQKLLQTKDDYRVEETMAESLYFLGQTDEALRAFARYVDKAPATDERLSSAYYYVGECYTRLKQYEHADIAFTTAVTLEPGMYYWWYRLGWVREALGLYRQAYDAYSKSLALNPDFKFAKEGRQRVKAKADL